MADDAPKQSSSPLPQYMVLLNPADPKFAGFADFYYKTFVSDGKRKIDQPPAHFKGDFLSLLDMMLARNEPYVLIVTHAFEEGVYMPLAQADKHKHYAPAYASRKALSLLLVIALLRAGIKGIDEKPKDKQTVQEWRTLNRRRERYDALANKQPLEAFKAAQRQEPLDSKVELSGSELEKFELDAERQALNRKPGDHTKEFQALEKRIRELEAAQRRREEEEKDSLRRDITEWIETNRKSALKLSESHLDQLLSDQTAIKSLNLKDVQIRGCNLGKDREAMELFRLFLDSDQLSAPKVKTGYGRIPVVVEGHPLLRQHRTCKPKELLRPSGCWWSFDDNDFQLLIRHVKDHKFEGQARAISKAAKDEWVKDHLGLSRTALGNLIPIHFMDDTPPAFPLEKEFESNLEEVSR